MSGRPETPAERSARWREVRRLTALWYALPRVLPGPDSQPLVKASLLANRYARRAWAQVGAAVAR